MALVITLILLSVTLVMALAFLAISTRERSSITTDTQTRIAGHAADSALAAAVAQIGANVLASKNPYSYGLLVSTNYINGAGFQTGVANLTNVSYVYGNGAPLNTVADMEQNLANLFYLPRPPVFIPQGAGYDFRYYLDLNRNGMFDTNGLVPESNGTTNFQTGDPEWIGVLEHPGQPYGPNNRFISRFAYFCQPIGNEYDLNYLYNQTMTRAVDPNPATVVNDGFYRNQGVGSWEINLAAFFADLNTNQWNTLGAPYNYLEPANFNTGLAFEDAQSLLSYRYGYNYNLLAPVGGPNGLFTTAALFPPFQNNIDFYTDLFPPMTFPSVVNAGGQLINVPWAGANNTNQLFDLTGDLFDPAKSSAQFVTRLQNAGTGTATYDRYTFYRLLEQLGTGSMPESGKMNLNHDNLTVNGPPAGTNFLAWTPLGFFTNAADRMLLAYTTDWLGTDTNSFNNYTNTFGASVTRPFGVTGIPVLVNGRMVYSPAVQRVLQLAANIYDSTTGNMFPSVFRPLFTQNGNGDIYITGYNVISSVSGTADPVFSTPFIASTNSGFGVNVAVNVYGVPWIIGAKKGLPNFNQFAEQSTFFFERKLWARRPSLITHSMASTSINQQLFIAVTNDLAVQCWNSYASDYKRPTTIFVLDHLQMSLTNDDWAIPVNSYDQNLIVITNINNWPGTGWSLNYQAYNPASFKLPINTSFTGVPQEIYNFAPAVQPATTDLNTPYQHLNPGAPIPYPQPHWGFNTTNNLQVVMIDTASGAVIDYVQLAGPNSYRNITSELITNIPSGSSSGMWNTNIGGVFYGKKPYGIYNQLDYSQTMNPADLVAGDTGTWDNQFGTVQQEMDYFNDFLTGNHQGGVTNNFLEMQVPFTPYKLVQEHTTWQANDPLVHYMASDLVDPLKQPDHVSVLIPPIPNERYAPWGGKMITFQDSDTNTFNLALKDPLMWTSDFWDFPTNKFPTIGWLGRVHRGTPWQTVYLKASNVLLEKDPKQFNFNPNYGRDTWFRWTGDGNSFDAGNSSPTTDRLLFDLFTTAPNDNATRGQLPVNQKNFAAWSALFSGMAVPTNLSGAYVVINPAGANGASDPYLGALFNSISGARSAPFKNPANTFKHIGDVLSASALTEQSPFLPWKDPVQQQIGISDELYEWLPQQMMSLLKVSTEPRYVIYSYGQTLVPAGANAIDNGGNFPGIVTNYQVVAERVTRAVVRIVGAPTNTHAVVESYNLMPPK